MRIGFEVFLTVAKELSVSKAAAQLHITQQCASDHIRRLEKEYQVLLFERKPRFRLTQAGEIMLHSLQNIQIVECSMEKNLGSIAQGTKGMFSLGISTSRAPIILPRVLPHYYHDFPNVNISFSEEDTQVLEERLLSGQIDLFIGVNTTPFPEFQISTLSTDELMLVIASDLLHRNFSPREIECMRGGIDLNQFSHVPFTLSFKTGKVNHAIQEYLDYHNVQLNVTYNISDSETQIMLCTSGICASLCPKMLLATAYRHNLSCGKGSFLHMFPVKNLGRQLRVDLVSHKDAVQPLFIRSFMEIIQEEVCKLGQFDPTGLGGQYDTVGG
ncbi:HTH-type transcriptional regulator ArgP [anaerobic digester metagenome]|nr:LysR family transcriptional regulator [Clostridium sp.]